MRLRSNLKSSGRAWLTPCEKMTASCMVGLRGGKPLGRRFPVECVIMRLGSMRRGGRLTRERCRQYPNTAGLPTFRPFSSDARRLLAGNTHTSGAQWHNAFGLLKVCAMSVEKTPVQNADAPLAPRGLRLTDASRYAGCSLWFLRTAIWSGQLRAMKLGKRVIVLKEDLDSFLSAQRDAA